MVSHEYLFIPRRDVCLQTPVGVQLFLLMYYFLRKRILDFQFTDGFLPFWVLENVFPPKGRLLGDSCRGPFVSTYFLFWVSKTLEAFQFSGGFLPKKKNPSKCFIPRRDVCLETPVRFQLFLRIQLFLLMSYFVLRNVYVYWTFNLQTVFCLLKIFYPPEGLWRAEPEGGPIVFTYVLFWVRKRILDLQFTDSFLPFWDPPQCFIRWDGWTVIKNVL